jgi:hypothetical protein
MILGLEGHRRGLKSPHMPYVGDIWTLIGNDVVRRNFTLWIDFKSSTLVGG